MDNKLKQQTFYAVIWSALERFSVQGVQFILSFVIARQLYPSDYGLMAMLAIFISLSQCFIDSGFSNALIQKQNRTQVDYSTVFYFNVFVGICVYLLLLLLSSCISDFYNQPILKELIKWVGLNLIINSFATVQRTILIIKLNFKRQAIISFVSAIISGCIAIYMAITGFGVWTLVIQGLLNSSITVVLLWISSNWKPCFMFSRTSFKELFSFGSKIMVSGLIATFSDQLNTIVIGKLFPSRDLGNYSKGSTLPYYTSSNIANILDRTFYPVLCQYQDDNEMLEKTFYKFIRISAFLVFPMTILLLLLAEPFIRIVLTDKWIGAVKYMEILCLAYMWHPIIRITWNLLNVKHRSDLSLKAEVIKRTCAIIVLLLSAPFGIEAICWGQCIYSLFDIIVITQMTKKVINGVNLKNHIMNIYQICLQVIIMAIVVVIIRTVVSNTFLQLFCGLLIGGGTYILISLICKSKELSLILNMIKRKV